MKKIHPWRRSFNKTKPGVNTRVIKIEDYVENVFKNIEIARKSACERDKRGEGSWQGN